MKYTRANVAKLALEKGYQPVQIDGIPEGFAFIIPKRTVGTSVVPQKYIAFVPFQEQEYAGAVVTSSNLWDLQEKYFNTPKIRYGK